MEQTTLELTLLEFQPKTKLTILANGRVVTIPYGEITHISHYRTDTVVYTADRRITIYQSFDELLNELPVNDFFQVHRNHIIAVKALGQIRVPVSRHHKGQLIKRLGEILDKGYNQ